MKFGFNFGFLGNGNGIAFTNCIIKLTQLPDGWWGFDLGQDPTGTLTPDKTSSGIQVYSFKFNDVSGDWIVQFGVAGDENLPNSTQGVLQFSISETDNVLLVWNEANLRYEGNDIDTAKAVVVEVGNDVCFRIVFVPELFIFYDFSELETTEDEDA